MKLELGCGNHPTPGFVHHDRVKHSPHVEMAFDLAELPWPLEDESVDELLALDVFEHLAREIIFPPPLGRIFVALEVQEWLDECWRVLNPGGLLEMRLPAYSNPYSWRDPTHQRVFHQESFLYWCPEAPGTVHRDFGRYYFGAEYDKWWRQQSVTVEAGDFRYKLRKCATQKCAI